MQWVTWEHIGVDRMASIWLIRRWIDTKAEFLFIPATNPLPKGAEPFDIDEADLVQEVNVEPIAPGLDAICRGIRRTSTDDYEALEQGIRLYEALYAELSAGES